MGKYHVSVYLYCKVNYKSGWVGWRKMRLLESFNAITLEHAHNKGDRLCNEHVLDCIGSRAVMYDIV